MLAKLTKAEDAFWVRVPLSWRPDFLFGSKSGAPTMEVLWTVWKAPYDNATTLYEPLLKPRIE